MSGVRGRVIIFNPSEGNHIWGGSSDEDRNALLNQEPVSITISADLNPYGFAAVSGLLNAIKDGREVAVVFDSDLVGAVVEFVRHGSTVGASG